jgi:hypothetical protein
MANAGAADSRIDDPEVQRDEWLGRLDDLAADVEDWAEALGWATRRIAKKMRDSRLGPYEAPAVLMQKERKRPRVRTPAEVILERVGGLCGIPEEVTRSVHEVRACRNKLIHDRNLDVPAVTIVAARGHLQTYLARLPWHRDDGP